MDMRQLNLSKYSSRSNDIEEAVDNLIIIEPTMGVIAPRQSINIDIILSSSKSLNIKEDIPCFIDILPNSPLWLHIEAEFTVSSRRCVMSFENCLKSRELWHLSIYLRGRTDDDMLGVNQTYLLQVKKTISTNAKYNSILKTVKYIH
ncbi:unnamed protein product [Trichobilharzia regenti]|nr:unnamed protein product [Trichobilharzia regenti]